MQYYCKKIDHFQQEYKQRKNQRAVILLSIDTRL